MITINIPANWTEAEQILNQLNCNKTIVEPRWDFDLGFKLMFEGPILYINSRFHPPKQTQLNWIGDVLIYIKTNLVLKETFECSSLQELQEKVETFVNDFVERLTDKIK